MLRATVDSVEKAEAILKSLRGADCDIVIEVVANINDAPIVLGNHKISKCEKGTIISKA